MRLIMHNEREMRSGDGRLRRAKGRLLTEMTGRSAEPDIGGALATATQPGPATGRDTAIDALRGACIVSMTTAHLAAGSWPYLVTHSAVFIDGAVGFVLLSGVMVGRTQRRTIVGGGLLAGQRKLLRRVGVIYAANLALCIVGFLVVAVDPARNALYAGVAELGGPVPAAFATLSLQVNPQYTSILSLYVVLLLLAMVAVAALSRRQPAPVVAGSLALYAAGLRWPDVFTFTERPGSPGAVNWATWQVLFLAALLIGWYWNAAPVRRARASSGLGRAAGTVVLVGAAAGWVATTGEPAPWKQAMAAPFTDGLLGPGRILMAFAAVIVGYHVCRWVLRTWPPLLTPFALIGRRALDCYVLLSVVVIVLPSVLVYRASGWLAVGVTFDVLALMVGWCLLRDRLRKRPVDRAVNRAVDRDGGTRPAQL